MKASTREELQNLRWEAEGWLNHFQDFIQTGRKYPPFNMEQTITAMWTIATDAEKAFSSFRERIEKLIKEES